MYRTPADSTVFPLLLLLLLLLSLGLENDLLLIQELRQITVLVHGHQDVAAADELLVDVQLWDRGPVGELLDALAQLRILEDVEGGELVRVDALQAQDLDGGAGEAALGGLGGALHEEHDGRRADGLLDRGARLVGEEAELLQLEGRQGLARDLEGSRAGRLPQQVLRKR